MSALWWLVVSNHMEAPHMDDYPRTRERGKRYTKGRGKLSRGRGCKRE